MAQELQPTGSGDRVVGLVFLYAVASVLYGSVSHRHPRILDGVAVDHLLCPLLDVDRLLIGVEQDLGIVLKHSLLVAEDAHGVIKRVSSWRHNALSLLWTSSLPENGLRQRLEV